MRMGHEIIQRKCSYVHYEHNSEQGEREASTVTTITTSILKERQRKESKMVLTSKVERRKKTDKKTEAEDMKGARKI